MKLLWPSPVIYVSWITESSAIISVEVYCLGELQI